MVEAQMFHAQPIRMCLQRNFASGPRWQVATQSFDPAAAVWSADGRQKLQENFQGPNRVCMAVLSSGEGSLGIETRQMNAGSIILSQDDKIAFIRKVYNTIDGIVYMLDLPAGGPLSVDETSLDTVRENEVDREEVILLHNGRMILTQATASKELQHKNAIWANYVKARRAHLKPIPNLASLLYSRATPLPHILYENFDVQALPSELFQFTMDRDAYVEIKNAKGKKSISTGAIIAHPEGFDLLDIRRLPEAVNIQDILSFDLETITDDRPFALNRSLVWLSIDELANLSKGGTIEADMTGPEGYSVFTVDPRKIGFKSLGGTFVDTLLNYRTKR